MKAPKIIAAITCSAAAIALAAGLAYAAPTVDPKTAPMPEKAQSTSIAKQVTATIVYQDQEDAEAMATEFKEIHNQLALDAVAQRADLTYQHSAAAEKADESKDTSMKPRTIDVNGDVMGYVNSFGTASAPKTGAGLWMGSDSTTDGSWGYFIGHNPGSFTRVMTLKNGDPVTICDSDGNTRTYHVVDEFIVPDDTYWEDIESRVVQYGESVIVQTCCGDNAHYRVVIAE